MFSSAPFYNMMEDVDDNTVQFWWDEEIHIRVNRSTAVPGNGVFEFDANFRYDIHNNVVGKHDSKDSDNDNDTRLGNPDRVLMGKIREIDPRNFELLQQHFDMTDKDMRVYTALHQVLCSAMSNHKIVGQRPKPKAPKYR